MRSPPPISIQLVLLGFVVAIGGIGLSLWFLLDLLDFPEGASIRPMVQVGRSLLAGLGASVAGLIFAALAIWKGRKSPFVWVLALLLVALSLSAMRIRQRAEDRIVAAHRLTLEE